MDHGKPTSHTLPVLPSSGKVEQLRRDIMSDRQTQGENQAEPTHAAHDSSPAPAADAAPDSTGTPDDTGMSDDTGTQLVSREPPDAEHLPADPKEKLAAPPLSAPAGDVRADAAPDAAPSPAASIEQKLLEGRVIEALRTVFDPEIPVNIYDLGLIYDIQVDPTNAVQVKMTLTAPACPVAGTLPGEVEKTIESIPEVKSANVELVWDPPWDRSRMSETALLTLGMF